MEVQKIKEPKATISSFRPGCQKKSFKRTVSA